MGRAEPTVLVTGGGGFIGRHAVTALLERGHRVVALSRTRPARSDPRLEWRACDLLARDSVEAALDGVQAEALLHLAWDVAPGYWTSDRNVDWLEASLRLLRLFRRAGGTRVVSAGTCAEYDWRHPAIAAAPIRETDIPFAPHTLYAACKRAFHLTLERYAQTVGLSAAWGLLFFLYGPDEEPERLVPHVARSLLAGERPQTTEGRQIRDFIDARDAGAAFAALVASNAQGAINIGSGTGTSVRELVDLVRRFAAPDGEIAYGGLPARAGDPSGLVADIGRLKEEVGFAPSIGLETGVRDAVEWWRGRSHSQS